jgi:hypothetical protein
VPQGVSFASSANKQRVWDVANVLCKRTRSKRLVAALLLLSALLQNSVAGV